MAVMPGDACSLWIHRVSQNHVPCVIIISGRVVGKAAFYRFLVIVSTIIYSAYPPEKRLVLYFLFHSRLPQAACVRSERLVSKFRSFESDTSRLYHSIKRNCVHGVSGSYRNSIFCERNFVF